MSRPVQSRVLSAVVATFVVAACSGGAPSSDAKAARLIDRRCELIAPSATDCYWLEVPENRVKPSSRQIRLWVAVSHPRGARADALPLVYLSGGPGDVSSTRFLTGPTVDFGVPRDHVALDQRGTGRSKPRLDCAALAAPPAATQPWGARLAAVRREARACAARYRRAHIDIDGYNSHEDAADVADLRRLLGYREWLVRGVSYGGRVGQELVRQDPKGTAGAILDSPVTYRAQGAASLIARAADAIARLAAACHAQPKCARGSPDVAGDYTRAIARLDAAPHHVILQDAGRRTDVVVTGQELVSGIWSAQYDPSLIDLIPPALTAVAGGNTAVIDALAPKLARSSTDQALGTFAVMTCADDEAATTAADRAAIVEPGDAGTLLLGWPWPTCGSWHVAPAPAARPAQGATPVLVREGGLDPVAPPKWAEEITRDLPHSATIVTPAGGHADYGGGCPNDIAGAFLDNPRAALDTSCMNALPKPFG